METTHFGVLIRERREALRVHDRAYSLRKVAQRIGIEPAYLSKIERGEFPPPGEETICALAQEIGGDPDFMLALAGKVSRDLQEVIRKRPKLFANLIRELKDLPDDAIVRLSRQVRDGDW